MPTGASRAGTIPARTAPSQCGSILSAGTWYRPSRVSIPASCQTIPLSTFSNGIWCRSCPHQRTFSQPSWLCLHVSTCLLSTSRESLLTPSWSSCVNNRRQASDPLAKSATTIEDLVLSNALKKTEDIEMFLLHDNGQEVEDSIIAYVTTQNLEQLNTAITWLCDGTFATCPTIFRQLWVLHGQFNDQVIPLVFFLLPGAKTEGYTRAFKIVWDTLCSLPTNQLPPPTHATRANPSSAEKDESTLAAEQLAHVRSLGPKVIIMDFEQAQFRAFEATFNGEVQSCFFHFRQALIKNLKSEKDLFEKYLNNGKGKCCFALT
ncbi:hypothetical protein DSO57_1039659 [Entomophthora muscae]|uniref:Uncharacterized protein n=1 Tax=Entomophthora muscae TaxID=34485 RepID=A0ACC2TZT2_9FUNG|nr:hypothetical protein DSO57_1039659 [Entomophthora muscae]